MVGEHSARLPSLSGGLECVDFVQSSSQAARESDFGGGLGDFWSFSLEELCSASSGTAAETLAWREVSQLFISWTETREKLNLRKNALTTRLRRLMLFLPGRRDSRTRHAAPVSVRCPAQNAGGLQEEDEDIQRNREARLVEVLCQAQEETEALQLFDRFFELLDIRCGRETPYALPRTLDQRNGGGEVRRVDESRSEGWRLGGQSSGQSTSPVHSAADDRLRRERTSTRQAACVGQASIDEARLEVEREEFSPLPLENGLGYAREISDLEAHVKRQMCEFFSPSQDTMTDASAKGDAYSLEETLNRSCSPVLGEMNQIPGSIEQMLQIQIERIQAITSDMATLVKGFLETRVCVSSARSSMLTNSDRNSTAGHGSAANDKRGKGPKGVSPPQEKTLFTRGSQGGSRKTARSAAGESVSLSHFQCLVQLRLLCEAGAQSVSNEQFPENEERLPPDGRQNRPEQAEEVAKSAGNVKSRRAQAETVRSALLETSSACAAILASTGEALKFFGALQVACSSGELWEEESEASDSGLERCRRFANDLDQLLDQLPTCTRALQAASRLCGATQVSAFF
ncbi:hypothetical protein TGCAST_273815 [Toxoplasma gondii CAST]|uniref:Uncharacterized protein n=1 Tax=Toxoplasma gondii CAST TaxID=943122 RepID=A0A425I9E5_TOXGO|nr:hypothetical protein TGCAST_273815 [Toxoplasma gondii CAST]